MGATWGTRLVAALCGRDPSTFLDELRREVGRRTEDLATRREMQDLVAGTADAARSASELRSVRDGLADQLDALTPNTAVDPRFTEVHQRAHEAASRRSGWIDALDALESELTRTRARISACTEPPVEAIAGEALEHASKAQAASDEADRAVRDLNDAVTGFPIPSKPGCKVADCDRKVKAKGFCSKHYARWRRGTLEGFDPPPR